MIAVTGANGLLGSFIVRQLIDEKIPFVALKRKQSDTSLLQDVATKISWRDADVCDPVALHEALKDVTQVIHTAAMVSFNPREAKKILNVNVQGTKNVVDACLVNNVARLLHISSVAALGRLKGLSVINDDNKWIDNPLNSTYAQSKYKAELEIIRGQEEGLSTVIINPSVILAPTDWNKSSAQLFKYVWKQKRFFIDGSLNYVDVRDVASITLALLRSTVQGERFIVNSGHITYKDFFGTIGILFNKRPPSIKLDKLFLYIVAFLENLRAMATGATPLITRETARLAGTHFNYNNNKIRNELNFEFQSVDQTLQWCCNYYLEKINQKK